MTAQPDIAQHLAPARQLPAGAPGFVGALRQRGMARFAALGFPTTRIEDWKYTNLAPIARESFALAPDGIDGAGELAAADHLGGAIELVFVNGRFAEALSTRRELPPGAAVGSLAEAIAVTPALVEPHLGSLAAIDDDGVVALNSAFVQDGVFVHLSAGCRLAAPIHCLFVSLANGAPTVSHPRVLVVADAGSAASVIEQYVGRGRYWTNAVSEIVVGPGASIAHHKVQREDTRAYHLAAIAAEQRQDSRFASHAVALGAALSRSAIATRLDAPGAVCDFDGLYIADGTQHVDHHTTIDHAAPRGTSRELYKGILAGRATGVFNGKVFVRPDAQQSDAQQMNQNLLLSDDAQVDTKPQLEIFADDVKCSHGATIGQLDDDAIFYLRARGIDQPDARRLLIYGFANELVERIAVESLRRQMEAMLADRLPAVVGALA
ncbi:Fe-S cluster assembly protein SufD [bacterium]|nr:Fe-S cluster assembly protein SufD [bacterium]